MTRQPSLPIRLLKLGVFGWINPVDAASENSDRTAVQRRVVGGAINAAGKAGDDDEPGFGQFICETSRQLHAGGGALPRSDDGDRRRN